MEGVFIDKDKNVTVTDGLRDAFELLNEDYTVKQAVMQMEINVNGSVIGA